MRNKILILYGEKEKRRKDMKENILQTSVVYCVSKKKNNWKIEFKFFNFVTFHFNFVKNNKTLQNVEIKNITNFTIELINYIEIVR